jgi:hypothetical protein
MITRNLSGESSRYHDVMPRDDVTRHSADATQILWGSFYRLLRSRRQSHSGATDFRSLPKRQEAGYPHLKASYNALVYKPTRSKSGNWCTSTTSTYLLCCEERLRLPSASCILSGADVWTWEASCATCHGYGCEDLQGRFTRTHIGPDIGSLIVGCFA